MAASYSKDVAPALEEAKQFLAGLIGCDGTPVKEIEKEAKEAGLSWATLRRAKAFAMNTGLAFAYRQTKGRGTHLGRFQPRKRWGRLTSYKETRGVRGRWIRSPNVPARPKALISGDNSFSSCQRGTGCSRGPMALN
jgi:hypothetical protein